MTEEKLKQYHGFCIAVWQYFKKYQQDGISDDNLWEAYDDSDRILLKHRDVLNADPLMKVVQETLWMLAPPVEWSEERVEEVFQKCKGMGLHSVQCLMEYVDRLTAAYPQHGEFVVERLAELIQSFGGKLTVNQIKAYSKAGWMYRLEGDDK